MTNFATRSRINVLTAHAKTVSSQKSPEITASVLENGCVNSNITSDFHSGVVTSSSAMAERPRELGDFKKPRVNGGTDSQSLKDSQFPEVFPQPLTDPHHMVIK